MRRKQTYKLVRCGNQKNIETKSVRWRCALAGLLSLLLFAAMVSAFLFPRPSTVVAAQKPVLTGVESMDVTGGDATTDGEDRETVTDNQITADEAVRETNGTGMERELVREEILVALDAGHGGEDEGSSRSGVLEKTVNWQIVKAVETQLTALGYQVLLIREGDETLSLQERVNRANDAEANIYVSIHQNACEQKSSDIAGIEVWYNAEKKEQGSKRLAQLIHNDLILYTKAWDRHVVEDDSLLVIRETNMPACLVETGFLSNSKERELLTTTEYQQKVAEGIVSGIDLYFFPKTMYLTFDDGPSAENTEAVLDILKEQNVKATFFLIGENVEKHPEVAKRIVEEGHTIGIHCYNHDYEKLYESVDSYVTDFEKAKEVVQQATGIECRLFRFPGGSINSYNKAVYQDIVDEMTARGYIYFDWNASLEDASRNNAPETLLKNAKESTLGRKRVIMLAHDVVYNTTQCLEDLLEQFPEYRMMPLSEDVEPIQF